MQAVRRFEPVVVIIVFAVLFERFLVLIHDWGVNIPFSDNWQTFSPLFDGGGYWDGFLRQHGPHRLGVGFVVTMLLMKLSSWNINWESYFALSCLAGAALAFLWLRRERGWRIYDVAPLALILSKVHYETVIIVPSAYHSIVPLLLLFLLALTQLSSSSLVRYGVGSALSVLSLFTGFGIVTAGVATVLFVLDWYQRKNAGRDARSFWEPLVGLIVIGLAGVFFLRDYVPQSGARGDVVFPHLPLSDYLYYLGSMFGGVFQLQGWWGFVVGVVMISAVGVSFVQSLRLLLLPQNAEVRLPRILFLLSGTTLAYAALTAIGRVHLGVEYATGSRYMALLIPGIVAWYLYCDIYYRGLSRRVVLALFVCLVLCTSLRLSTAHKGVIAGFQGGKRNWLVAYRDANSLDSANRLSAFSLQCATEEQVEYIRTHFLSAFAR